MRLLLLLGLLALLTATSVSSLAAASDGANPAARRVCKTLHVGKESWTITPRHTKCRKARRIVRRLARGGDQPRGWRCSGDGVVAELVCVTKRYGYESKAAQNLGDG